MIHVYYIFAIAFLCCLSYGWGSSRIKPYANPNYSCDHYADYRNMSILEKKIACHNQIISIITNRMDLNYSLAHLQICEAGMDTIRSLLVFVKIPRNMPINFKTAIFDLFYEKLYQEIYRIEDRIEKLNLEELKQRDEIIRLEKKI
jgi:hypothetical protein